MSKQCIFKFDRIISDDGKKLYRFICFKHVLMFKDLPGIYTTTCTMFYKSTNSQVLIKHSRGVCSMKIGKEFTKEQMIKLEKLLIIGTINLSRCRGKGGSNLLFTKCQKVKDKFKIINEQTSHCGTYIIEE